MKAIIVVDCQNDFSDDGAIKVPGAKLLANNIYNFINRLDRTLYKIIFSKDAHPEKHCSFAEWGPHCIINTNGFELMAPLNMIKSDLDILKAQELNQDSFSIFNNEKKPKILNYLNDENINEVYLCGLVKDICVIESAIDICNAGIGTTIITDLSIPISEAIYKNKMDENQKIKECISNEIK
ncbi:MAG: isochorismatase family protein [Mycoplasma sp.]